MGRARLLEGERSLDFLDVREIAEALGLDFITFTRRFERATVEPAVGPAWD
jgi:hypothetical protein